MEQGNVEQGNRLQPEPPQANVASENANLSNDALKKKADALERDLRKWFKGELKSSWQKDLETKIQELSRRVEAAEASRETQVGEIKRLTEENRALNNVVAALKQARQTQSEENKRLSQEAQTLKNDVDALRQDVAALNSSLRAVDASAVERKRIEERIEEKYRAEIARLESEIRRLTENKKTLLVENEKLTEEIEALKHNERQFEEILKEKESEKRENEAKENADPHKETQGGAFAVSDANSSCRDAQNEIYWALVEALNDVADGASLDARFRREAPDYICELFDAAFGDCWDDASTPKSLAERLGADGENANKIKEQEEKIKANVAKLKKICARWLRENPNVEACRLYRPKPGESLKERENWKSCKTLGNKRLNEIDPPLGGCVGLTLIPGVYSQTKGSRVNLAPAYVVAQPNDPTEVEKTQEKETAPHERELESTDFDLRLTDDSGANAASLGNE